MYEAIVFDSDGILVEPTDLELLRAAIRETFEAFGVADPPPDHVEALHHVTLETVERICANHGIDPAPFWRHRDDTASRRQRDAIERGEKPPYPDLEVLRAFDRPVGVVSNTQHETIRFVLETFDLAETVATFYGREHSLDGIRWKKPNPYYIQRALEDLGTTDALYVGDSQKDIVAANRAGIDSAFVRRPHRQDLELDPEPTFEVEGLAELQASLEAESPPTQRDE